MTSLDIKSMSSPDVEIDVWRPNSREDVYFLLELEIGLAKDSRADVFQLMVATPEGLRQHSAGEVISDRGSLIVSDFSWATLRKALQAIVAASAGRDWNESVFKLQRHFRWEYEDYVQPQPR